jgi:hypothetical protein
MEKLLFILALAAMATFADAQGTIQFANGAGTRFRLGFNLAPGSLYFGVFVGATANSLSSQPVLPLGTNTSTLGLMSAPNPQAYQIPGFEANTTVFLLIRAWGSRFGADWQRAYAEGSLCGQTEVRSVILGPSSGPGTVVWSSTDLTKFQPMDIYNCPEPSTIALVGLGLGSLFLFRRPK